MMKNLKLLGEKLKIARTENKYTQNQVAKFLEIQREQLSYYETGTREISLSLLIKLADFYGKSLEYFFNEDKDPVLKVAYRASELVQEDIEKIAWAKKFVSNLYELEKVNRGDKR